MTPRDVHQSVLTRLLTVLVIAMLNASVIQAYSQLPSVRFEVASIRQNRSGDPNTATSFIAGGGFAATNATLTGIIQEAYGVRDDRMRGGPGWIRTDRYDVAAKPQAAVTSDESRMMLQSLLAERFALKSHWEKQEGPGFILTVAKAGPKLRINTQVECLPPCGGTNSSVTGKLSSRKVPMSRFANSLAEILGRPVVDMTSLNDSYDIDLDWAPDATRFGGRAKEVPGDFRPSLFTALQDLGLKLEAAKVPLDFFVIDQVSRPSEN
jgi:uncharacterized protein (TIGR03435 family)